MALTVPSSFYRIDAGLHALSFSPGFNVHKLYLKQIQLFTETSYLLMNFITQWLSKPASTVVPMVLLEMNHKMYRDCVYIYIYICNQKSENIDFKGLAEVINKLIFNNLHNPPSTKYFDIIINPLYSKQLLNLVLVEDCGGI